MRSKRVTYWMLIDHEEWMFATSRYTTLEEGAAVRILMARAQEQDLTTERDLAGVVGLSLYRWRKLAPTVMPLVERLMKHTTFHKRIGREKLPEATKRLIYQRDGEVCAYCGATDGPFDIDHREPVAQGGTNDPSNLCVACVPCNLSKRDKPLSEWLQ